ncbi:protein S100-A16 isoform X3 [Oncorhynchus tshawytscha]|uniref:protein S100-A16 isoform X3 n=1 Tax=Oncorhynchus tshawytscha TaxID=74940 RepID=UPI000D0A89A5|nr:protein S100-A16 isoform X3 [Oncorhynchus tshawytscha]
MESAIQTIVGVFLKSAKGKESLGGNDFQKLVKSQLHNIMMDTDSSEAVKKMRQGLDSNQDGKVNFEEYMDLVGYLATSLSVQCTAAVETPAESAATAPEIGSTPADVEEEKTEAEAQPEAATAVEEEKVEVVEKVEEAENVEEPAEAGEKIEEAS